MTEDDIAEDMPEYEWCLVYEPEGECRGASGRKMRQVCVWCPMMKRFYDKQDERTKKDNVEESN